MYEWIIGAIVTYLFVSHITLVKRVKHLEKIVRWVEIQSNENKMNIYAASSLFDSMPSTIFEQTAEDRIARKEDLESANTPVKDRNEYLESLGVASNYIY